MKPAVFLDKDGTLVRNIPHNVDPTRIELLPGVSEGLTALGRTDYALFVVTNQPGLAQGRFTETEFVHVTHELQEIFSAHGCSLGGMYACPHDPNGNVPRFSSVCDCRKPAPGLLLRAAQNHDIDLSQSWMIGDILNDVEAGHRAGCRSIFVDNGNETEWRRSPLRRPEFTVKQFDQAVEAILRKLTRTPSCEVVG